MLGLPRSMIQGLVESKYVVPKVGPRGAFRFTFSDLVVMRAAQELLEAKVPARRVSRTLKQLRARLPENEPFGGLRIKAAGDRIVVQEGARQWEANTGQYVLDLAIARDRAELHVLPPSDVSAETAAQWFARASELEEEADVGAFSAYARALEADPSFADAYINLGRLLHEQGHLKEAEAVYRKGIVHCGEDALLHYNFGVLLDELERRQEALQAYRAALALRPDLADGHYNIALLYQASGQPRAALRHLNAYRKLMPATR
ncbi:MAG: hypothetical protein C5B46_08320 [Proteobacteria bacterium]|nr:MAG: hypothetical protein C5B46_08320 [Pseudomonadota bacterium]